MLPNNKIKILLGYSFLMLGIFFLFKNSFGIKISEEELLGAALILFGVPSVYFSLNAGKRNFLLLSSILFFTGIILIVQARYDLYDTRALVFTSILFISGASMFLLFIENNLEKKFLYVSLTLMFLGYLSATHLKQYGLLDLASKIADTVDVYWPAVLIIFGVIIFVNRKK